MSAQWKSSIKRYLKFVYRRLPGPLQRSIHRLRHGGAASGIAGGSPSGIASEAVLAHLQESDRLLLAAVKMAQGTHTVERAPTFSAVALGPDRLLATHSHEPFLYLDPRELMQTPRIIAGCYEPGLHRCLVDLIQPGMRALEIGAGQGYHTLTLAALVQPGGKLLVMESDARLRAVLEDNLQAHELKTEVTLVPGDQGFASATEQVRSQAKDPLEWIRIDSRVDSATAGAVIRAALAQNPQVQIAWSCRAEAIARGIKAWQAEGINCWEIHEDGMLEPVTAEELEAGSSRGVRHWLLARELRD